MQPRCSFRNGRIGGDLFRPLATSGIQESSFAAPAPYANSHSRDFSEVNRAIFEVQSIWALPADFGKGTSDLRHVAENAAFRFNQWNIRVRRRDMHRSTGIAFILISALGLAAPAVAHDFCV
ncbi:MAG: hypothetical protein ABIN56_04780, partial [Dokdonella sp.]